MRVRFAQPHRPAARRQRADGALQLAARARHRRHVHPAHRGHRRRAVDARVGERPSCATCAGSASTGTRGPTSAASRGPYRQSERLHLYQSYAKELLAGDAAYYCFCSAAQLEAERQEALADGRAGAVRGHVPARCRASRRRRASRRASGRRSASACPRIATSSSPTSCAATSGFTPTSSAIRSSSAPTACRPTTSPSSSTMR